ncbi:hypothetical protein [Allorhizocola rhizosphaerae]|uniref:hypothetical protein n=1 Tax=Allorhizocola rhizosphaerae TaxID=1872709 RepID=UPI001FE7E49F|nr:hypothetical protein [Allorhizocola rhizosphaerae]
MYDLHLQTTELSFIKSMCFAVGGILRIRSLGPGQLKVEPQGLTSVDYEAAVYDVRFVRPGTVAITIPQDQQEDHVITVVIR